MVELANVHPLTDFLRNAKAHLKRLQKGGPLVLTVNGRVAAVLDSPASYQKLMQAQDRMEAIEGIRRGLESAERGEGRPAAEVLKRIRRKHRIPRGA
jgi:PHD/YefM family antitoxin component YafN of YafNO toxin-antitoxin module